MGCQRRSGDTHAISDVQTEVVPSRVDTIEAEPLNVKPKSVLNDVPKQQVFRGGTRFTQIYITDVKEFNAHHSYRIVTSSDGALVADVNFQKGSVKENGINGCHHEDLINIVIDRLESFQESEFKCRENAIALTKLEEALMWLDRRTSKRQQRGVKGTSAV